MTSPLRLQKPSKSYVPWIFDLLRGGGQGTVMLHPWLLRTSRWVAYFLAGYLSVLTLGVEAANRDAASQVARGLEKHRKRDFTGAAAEFDAAARLSPDEPRITYDRACALAAQGKYEEAEKLFQEARLSADAPIVAASHYNLGCLAASQARARLGADPAAVTPEVRQEAMELLTEAVASYRACLAVAPEHPRARHNLELLRIWMKQIQDVWRQRDREKQRESLGLLEFLDWIQQQQRLLRLGAHALSREEDSPRRRQAATLLGRTQRELVDEIAPLQQKIRKFLTEPPPSQPASPSAVSGGRTDPRLARALDFLDQLAISAKDEMGRAAVDLGTNDPRSAVIPQVTALERLDEIYRHVAPLDDVLRKSIVTEEGLVGVSQSASNSPGSIPDAEADEAAGDQKWVVGWAGSLREKAEQQLPLLEVSPPAAGAATPSKEGGQREDQAKAENESAPDSPPAEPLAEKLKAALRKTVELAPRVAEAATDAQTHLAKKEWALALPKQELALKLLQEIAESMPPPEQKPPPAEQEPDEKKQEKQDRKQQGGQDQKEGQEKQKQDEPSPPGKDDKKQESKQKSKENDAAGKQGDDRGQAPQTGNDEQRQGERSQQDLSRQRAEAILRQARQRERDYKERQRQIEVLLRGPVKVDKDW